MPFPQLAELMAACFVAGLNEATKDEPDYPELATIPEDDLGPEDDD